MTTLTPPAASAPPERGTAPRKPRRTRGRTSLFAHGEPLVWLTGGALCVALFMIVGLLSLVFVKGAATFWPAPLVLLEVDDGRHVMGEVTEAEPLPPGTEGARPGEQRRLVRTGNFDLTNEHFRWVPDGAVTAESTPEWALLLERIDWGRFHGIPAAFELDGEVLAEGPAAAWAAFEEHHGAVRDRWHEARGIEAGEIGDISDDQEHERLRLRAVALDVGEDSPEYAAAEARFAERDAELAARGEAVRQRIAGLDAVNAGYVLVMEAADGAQARVPLAEVVRAVPANQLGFFGKLGVYASRWWEFLTDKPRFANSEGGVWPAIFGTVLMTMIMTVFVVPFGILAALYLREYAKQGLLVSTVRIAVNNLAGVPSIVFGVFGLGFFCYLTGAWIDESFFAARLPSPTFGTGGILWASLTLALLTLPVVIVATEEALAAVPNSMREGSYACGASKWQTIRRIVLPRALPGIMTGVILAIARGAGEVAPLMLVGAAKLAPEMPFDLRFPYLHLERSFMHLGSHIYDVGFQSQNSEAAQPMVFTITLLLIGIVLLLDVAAITIRSRLRRRFGVGRI